MGEVIPAKKMREKIAGAKAIPKAETAEAIPEDDQLPDIVLAAGKLHENADQGEDAIIKLPGPPRILQRGGMLVRIVRLGPTSARRMKREDGAIGIVPVDVPNLVELLTEAAHWMRVDKRSNGYRVVNCPHEIASVILSRGQWKFPPLTGVLETPTLRPDWSVLQHSGYDAATGFYLDLGATQFDPIQTSPDRATTLAAGDQLLEVLTEFCFASDVDRSVAFAAILTALVRLSLPTAPLFGFSGTVMGSGKTYLAQVVNLIFSGRMGAITAPPKDSKEEDKMLFAKFLAGVQTLVYDNVEHQLSSDFICAALTSESIAQRLLSVTKDVTVSTACTFMVTGNNLVLAGDLSARALVSHLDPKIDHPEHRVFKRDLTTWIPKNRARLVPAALTFLRGYLASGERPAMEPWTRFPDWDNLIRAAIVWRGLSDPLLALRQGEAADPRRLEHQAAMEAWLDAFGDHPTPVRDAIKTANARASIDDHSLLDALLDVAGERGEVNLRRLGRWLSKMAGRIHTGLKIERGNVSGGSQTWRVVK